MIRLLKAFADWLDRRFPAKVMITEETWNAIDRRLQFLEMRAQTAEKRCDNLADAIRTLDDSITALKKQKEEAKPVTNPKRTFIETGDIILIK